jgi:hypothetical protein
VCQTGRKIAAEFEAKHLSRMPHPTYSPDLSPCDFWFFAMLKECLKAEAFPSNSDIDTGLAQIWNDLTFEKVASVFHEWKRRVEWATENTGEYYYESTKKCLSIFTGVRNRGGGRRLFRRPISAFIEVILYPFNLKARWRERKLSHL